MLLSRVVIACVLALGVTACDAGRRNPPGTEASRAADRVAGTNISGAYPMQSDRMPGNPPGTEASRATDRVAGTNTSGAYPMQSDGMPGNPPGTAAGRAANELLGTTATR